MNANLLSSMYATLQNTSNCAIQYSLPHFESTVTYNVPVTVRTVTMRILQHLMHWQRLMAEPQQNRCHTQSDHDQHVTIQ